MKRPGHSKNDVTALGTFVKLMRASESVAADVHRKLSAKGLSVSQFGILEALYHLGPMCQKDLAGKILKSAGNITMVIDNLEKQDLVSRRRSKEDRRHLVVSLTEKGEKFIAAIFPAHADRIRKRMSVLTTGEQQILSSLLRKLGQTPGQTDCKEVEK